jgi:ubiquinone/menaquinone biosynthesis C-methylase UbiE
VWPVAAGRPSNGCTEIVNERRTVAEFSAALQAVDGRFGGLRGVRQHPEWTTSAEGGSDMTAIMSAAPIYVLGQSDDETRRLIQQAQHLNPHTRRLLHDAKIAEGMRVLDVGTGAGDVAMMAAEMVGPSGSVVGMDRNPDVLAVARERAHAAGLTNVTFMEGDLHSVAPSGDFDAVIGRLVLLFMPDPAAALRELSHQLRPGGVAVFQELHQSATSLQSSPPLSLWGQVWRWIVATMEGAGVHLDMGYDLHRVFQAAGFPVPQMEVAAPLIRGDDPAPYEWAANTLASILPMTVKLGVATAEDVGIETLAERLRAETVAADAVVRFTDVVGAWARKPAA